MNNELFHINPTSNIPKYRQLVNNINAAISQNTLSYGDVLPSVNQLCEEANLSRDTVFKSYQLLKSQGVIDSVPNKGYYVAKEIRRVFLLLDTFKAYKEVMYHAFTSALPDNYIVDVQFHHYNPEIFKKLVQDSVGNYTHFVVMPFSSEAITDCLEQLPQDQLLTIDWNAFGTSNHTTIVQDFGNAVTKSLEEALPDLQKYDTINLVYPDYTNHPEEIKTHFLSFCNTHLLKSNILLGVNDFKVQSQHLYLCVSERSLGYLLSECEKNSLEIGAQVGIISYNETPMKRFIKNGISVISTDFKLMGQKAAAFILGKQKEALIIPTTFIKRQSI